MLKRQRCEDFETFLPQTKKLISEKLVDQQDQNKMIKVHEKTISLLFKAARDKKTPEQIEAETIDIPLCQQVVLSGNGAILSRNITDLIVDISLESRKSKCCHREAFVRSDCCNCTQPLCEYCGHSCAECGVFLCDSCVLLFGCGNVERPLCEKCALYESL
ncbi:apoptosis regulatory protein Siva-like [Eurosta solidaginis]|uniref:apoptosis regulatory protein Siva-like n=1 Tax=Eurosta solidaginis TaxID=178769 RepID=UPI0035312DFF